MKNPITRSGIQKWKYHFKLYFIGLLLSLVIVFIVGEILIRSKEAKEIKPPPYDTAILDERLGWKMKPNYYWKGEMKSEKGSTYSVELQFDEKGFKEYGRVDSKLPKILFIGDSYTQSVEASNDKTFYNLLKKELEFEVFAYGQAGYGTIQEYLILDEYYDQIQPDLIVWQVSSNDYIDNYRPLERETAYRIDMPRPYLNWVGEIDPLEDRSFLKKWMDDLKFPKFLNKKFQNIQYKFFNKSKKVGEYYISHQRSDYIPFKKALKITQLAFQKIKLRINSDTKLIAFPADTFQPQLEEYSKIFETLNIPFVEQVAIAIDSMKWNKHDIHSIDGYHWNDLGQETVAKALQPTIRDILKELKNEKQQVVFN